MTRFIEKSQFMFQLQTWWIKSSSYLAEQIPNWLRCPFTPPTFNTVPWKMLVLEDYFPFGMVTFHGLCQNLGCVPPIEKPPPPPPPPPPPTTTTTTTTRHVHVGRPCQPIAFRCFRSTQKAPTSLATIPTRPKTEEDTGWLEIFGTQRWNLRISKFGFLLDLMRLVNARLVHVPLYLLVGRW